jgi:long-chain acyl-CoA synthetase
MSPRTRKELHYGSRVMTCFVDRPDHVDELFGTSVHLDPERTALVAVGTRLSYRELDEYRTRVAAGLASRGFRKGDRLALMTGNCAEFVVTILAAARLGLIVVPMNILQRRPETTYMLNQCGAHGLVFEARCANELPAASEIASLRHRFEVGGSSGEENEPFASLAEAGSSVPAAEIAEEDPFCILYTSGTTGRPKGAVLTHLGVLHSVLHYEYGLGLPRGCVSALAVPASHVTGLVAIILATIRAVGTTVMLPEFKARSFLACVECEGVNYTLMVPAMYNLCLLEPQLKELNLSSWRIGGFGGGPMPQATIRRLVQELPNVRLANCYGATETSSPATLWPADAESVPSDTVGCALPCADVIVCDDHGHEVERGELGELWIAGPMTIPGYWNDENANRAAFAGGYWRSGDVGSVDEEGYVRIFDRRKDVINRAGYKVYCLEVEYLLATHAGVLECAVVPKPDEVLGERVHAFVVLRGEHVSAEELIAYCRRSLSEYKVPESVTITSEPLPRNANGKVMKSQLRATLAAGA